MQYAVLDFETGGLDNTRHALVSVGCLVLDENLNERFRYYTLIKDEPEKVIDQDALSVNGLTLEEIATGQPIGPVLNNLRFLLEGRAVVAHNAAFDIGFFNQRGFAIQEAIDTMFISGKIWPYQKAQLNLVCDRLHIQVENAHNSLGDVLLTAEALRRFAFEMNVVCLDPQPIDFEWFKKRR